MKPVIDLTIIVISYNTQDMTISCLKSVYEQTRNITYNVIIVDNSSNDGSATEIAKQFPKTELIKLEENIGFARANNLAAEKAIGHYILLLNPDTLVLNNAIENLLDFAKQNPKAGIWGGRTIFADGSLNRTSCFGKTTTWSLFCRTFFLSALFSRSKIFNYEMYGNWRHDTVEQVDIVSGCFFLITSSLWEQLAGFDKHFFMYGEEVDLCLRAKKMGYLPMVTPEATIIHYGGASEKTHAGKLNKILAAKISLIKKHSQFLNRHVELLLMYLYPLLRVVAFRLVSLLNNKHYETYCSWKSTWENRALWIKGNNND
jgi:GT2 family glycosyltransferase